MIVLVIIACKMIKDDIVLHFLLFRRCYRRIYNIGILSDACWLALLGNEKVYQKGKTYVSCLINEYY